MTSRPGSAPKQKRSKTMKAPASSSILVRFGSSTSEADYADAAAVPGLRIRLALFDLRQRLLQVRQDQPLRAAEAHHVDDVELIARDGRVGLFAQLAELGYDLADLVVPRHGVAQSGVGDGRRPTFRAWCSARGSASASRSGRACSPCTCRVCPRGSRRNSACRCT